MDPPQHSSGSQDSAEKLDLPPSSLFVPKFTKAREPRPLNRDGTPMNHELTRVPSAADLPPLLSIRLGMPEHLFVVPLRRVGDH